MYTLSKYKNEIDITSRMFLQRIKWLKIDDVLKLTQYDNKFLSDVITQYFYYETLPKAITDETEEFCNKKLSKKMKRKIEDMNKK